MTTDPQLLIDNARGRTLSPIPTASRMDHVDTKAVSPARSWRRTEETSSQASTSPEATRRKRLSFFGRNSSDASKHPLPALNPTMTTHKALPADPSTPTLTPHLRPIARSDSRRRTADPLESIRNSIFSRTRKTSDTKQVIPPRPTSRQTHFSKKNRHSQTADISKVNNSLIPFAQEPVLVQTEPQKPKSGQLFKSEKEYYHHRKKSSISPPFNFQHVTHTARKHLPSLDTVDEKDLTAKFWAVNAHQRPKEKLHGIKVEDLSTHRTRSLSDFNRPTTAQTDRSSSLLPSTVSHTVSRSVDETVFDETQETKFNPDDAYRSLDDVHQTLPALPRPGPPKHYSSMSALSTPPSSLASPRLLRDKHSFDSPPRAAPQAARTSLPLEPAPAPSKAFTRPTESDWTLSERDAKAKQPLPPVPHVRSQSGVSAAAEAPRYSLFPAPPVAQPEPAIAVVAKRSSKSEKAKKSSHPRAARIDVLDEPTWEDDIDFAYEQAAEGRCDFDWETATPPVEESLGGPSPGGSGTESAGGGVRLSAWLEQPAALTSNTSTTSQQSTNSDVAADATQHKRGSSVGHKGFAAARSASSKDTVPTVGSPLLTLETGSTHASTPPPKFSVTDADREKSTYMCSAVYYPTFDSFPEYLSDPESTRTGGSRHRKSSSFGSYQSSGQSLKTVSDTTRWSSASTSSIPDLMHSKRMSRTSFPKNRMSRPLESVPHSPSFDPLERDEDDLKKPEMAPAFERAVTDSFLMRRPDTPGDRQILFSAGRTVQRGRSATPNRLPARISPERETEQEGGWI